MTIFLVNLAINSSDSYGYNYGLGYISSVLKNNGFNSVYIILKNRKDISFLYKQAQIQKPGIIGFSAATSQFNYLKEIAKKIKSVSDSFIICGGPHPTLEPDCITEIPDLDGIIRSEGEFPLLEFAKNLENKKDFFSIENFWFKKGENIIKNPIRPFIQDLDKLPFPDKESLPYQKLIIENRFRNRFVFSRGCVYDCAYCSNKAFSELAEGPYFRQRSPEKAIEEIKLDARKYKFDFITIDDDTISLNKKWFYDFFTLYKKNFTYPFRCNLRPGTIDEDMMKLLKECKAKSIGIGIEHGNAAFRKSILKRDISNEKIIETFKLCDKYNISHYDFIMTGFPFENKNLFIDTVNLCREVSAKGAVSIFHPYPRTELGRICEEHKWVPQKEHFIEREEAVIDYPQFKKSDIQLCRDIFPFLIRCKFIPPEIILNKYMAVLLRLLILPCKIIYSFLYRLHTLFYIKLPLYRLFFNKLV